MRILLAEDDELLGDAIKKGLHHTGYAVDWFKDGQSALQALKTEQFDLIILDLGLPKIDGIGVLKAARGEGISSPVLILTARDSIEDQVMGLDGGADDYLTKPFDIEVLYARVRALQRRASNRSENQIIHGNLVVDPNSHSVSFEGLPVSLPRREFFLLLKLLENSGHVLSRNTLSQSLYSWEDEIDSNALEVHIHNLRKKFGNTFIRTIRGIGYMIEKVETND